MTRIWRFAFLAATAIISAAASRQERARDREARPRESASRSPARCARRAMARTATAWPRPIRTLPGQDADYITLQLAHFKAGIRVNPTMQAMAASLTDDDMRALGAYFAQQKPKGLAAKDPSLVKAAQQLWRGGDAANGVPACAACHSPTGAGIPKNYPAGSPDSTPTTRTRSSRRSRPASAAPTRREGRQRPRHGRDRAEDDRRPDEGGRRLRRRPALTHGTCRAIAFRFASRQLRYPPART